MLDPARACVNPCVAPIREVPYVDDRDPPPLQPRQATLSERPDRRGMGAYQASDSSGQTRWRQTARRHAPGRQWCHVCSEHRMPVALHPEGPAAAQYGERVFLSVELQRYPGEDTPRTLRQMPRAG